MTPAMAQELLYHDIVPEEGVAREHATLRAILAGVARVDQLLDLAAAGLDDADERRRFAEALVAAAGGTTERPDRRAVEARSVGELLALWDGLSPRRVVERVVAGMRAPVDTLERAVAGPSWLTRPLPNLYFTRDVAFVVGERAYRSRMASPVRRPEAVLAERAVRRAGLDFADVAWPHGAHIEGGDVLVLRRDVLLVGVGPRTTAASVDALYRAVARDVPDLAIVAVELPDTPSTIHLDMVATIIDRNEMLVYPPAVSGPGAFRAWTLRGATVREYRSLREAVGALGWEPRLIAAGGDDAVAGAREQYFSAANSFAFRPGGVLVYGANTATREALAAHDYAIIDGSAVLGGATLPDGRVAVTLAGTDLARGGGGPRCMTLPLAREPVGDG